MKTIVTRICLVVGLELLLLLPLLLLLDSGLLLP